MNAVTFNPRTVLARVGLKDKKSWSEPDLSAL